jgi:ribonuclease BN (tRNA processing enzyme)
VQRLLQMGVSPTEVSHLFVTHLHFDHCVDYAYLVLSRWGQGAGRIPELEVYGPAGTVRMTGLLFEEGGAFGPDIAARTQHPASEYRHEARGGELPRYPPAPVAVDIADGSLVETSTWSVQAARVMHCDPFLLSLAYRLDSGRRSVVVAGDAAPARNLATLARGASVLVSGCHFLNGDHTDPRLPSCCSGHLDAARLARDANVETLVLVHMPEALGRPEILERIVSEARHVFRGRIVVGRDLLDVPI